jgi:type II secretory pathway component PulK
VALIIVLLVTALLIALIFEFAYGTRVSLRAAANFRNSQRAYFLARSGLSFFAKYPELREIIPQGEYQPLPYVSEGDKLLEVRWEDESGKIDISQVLANDPRFNWQTNLFFVRGVNQKILNDISLWMTENRVNRFYLLSELHRFMRDEEFNKVQDALAMSQLTQVNVNTASKDVLKSVFQSAGYSPGAVESIAEKRTEKAFDQTTLADYLRLNNLGNLSSALTSTSNVFKVDLRATVGGYTRYIEAVVKLDSASGPGYKVNYWRSL